MKSEIQNISNKLDALTVSRQTKDEGKFSKLITKARLKTLISLSLSFSKKKGPSYLILNHVDVYRSCLILLANEVQNTET